MFKIVHSSKQTRKKQMFINSKMNKHLVSCLPLERKMKGCEFWGAIKELLKPLIKKVTLDSDSPRIVPVDAYCTGVIFNSITFFSQVFQFRLWIIWSPYWSCSYFMVDTGVFVLLFCINPFIYMEFLSKILRFFINSDFGIFLHSFFSLKLHC